MGFVKWELRATGKGGEAEAGGEGEAGPPQKAPGLFPGWLIGLDKQDGG